MTMMEGSDTGPLKDELQPMIDEIIASFNTLEKDIDDLERKKMFSGENDGKNVILSIHAGAGGTEAQDWARILFGMYRSWLQKNNIAFEVIDDQPGEVAGFKSITMEITGDFIYGRLKSEIGVHRLVRISPFDANKRRHTSFAAVNVYPMKEEVDFSISEKDVEITTFKASGKGGQYTNKTDSAVRAVHVPTGIVVACQSERSQHSNRASAMKLLDAKVIEYMEAVAEADLKKKEPPKQKIEWSSQIRSYVVQPQQSVKDNRSGFESSDIDGILGGDLDGLIHAYLLSLDDHK